MKKFILGFIVALVFLASSAVFAKAIVEKKWYVVDTLDSKGVFIIKTFDEDTNVVCYTEYNRAISCLKNN